MYEKVLKAAKQLEGVAHKTPVLTSTLLDQITGNQIFLKCENFQRAGAFKFRGAYNAISLLSPEQRRKGVITYSSGNHAQATALSSRLFDTSATIVLPINVSSIKKKATECYGANVVTFDPAIEKREDVAQRLIDLYGYTLIPPFNHENVVAGQGTIVKELIEEVGNIDFLFVQCSGAGLLSGSAISCKHLLPKCKVIGVQPELADYTVRAFKTGKIHRMENVQTVVDGLRGNAVGKITLPIIQNLVDDIITVSDMDVISTMYFVWTRLKVVVELAGVTGLTPLFHHTYPVSRKRIGVILSGGNVDVRKIGGMFNSISD